MRIIQSLLLVRIFCGGRVSRILISSGFNILGANTCTIIGASCHRLLVVRRISVPRGGRRLGARRLVGGRLLSCRRTQIILSRRFFLLRQSLRLRDSCNARWLRLGFVRKRCRHANHRAYKQQRRDDQESPGADASLFPLPQTLHTPPNLHMLQRVIRFQPVRTYPSHQALRRTCRYRVPHRSRLRHRMRCIDSKLQCPARVPLLRMQAHRRSQS